jgi:hypothetical protein
MMAQKAEIKKISIKSLRDEVENVEFEESKCVGTTMGINQEEWENEGLAEVDGELDGYRVELL